MQTISQSMTQTVVNADRGESKEKFKIKVLEWLRVNGIPVKRARVYDTRRYGLEVRIYHGTTSFPNTKRSRRMWKESDANGNNCTTVFTR